MKQELNITDLITDFQNSAQEVVDIFQRRYGVENILEGWQTGNYEQTGKIPDEGLKFYAFHGIGIAAHFEKKLIDFDFAYLPELRHDGFDLWRLTSFVKSQPNKYVHLRKGNNLKSEFDKLITDGLIANPKSEYFTSLYFWTKDLAKEQLADNLEASTGKKKAWWEIW